MIEHSSRAHSHPPQVAFVSSNNQQAELAGQTPQIRLRDVALLLFGALIAGAILGFMGALAARSFTDSKFVQGIVAGTAFYASWLLGYEWLAKARGWDSLQARFSTTRPKVLLAAAASGIGLIALLAAVGSLLRWLGIDLVQPPPLDVLPRSVGQLIFAIGLVAVIAPLAEELIFRGLLLDWLKAKMNVWAAALILSVIFALLHNNSFKLGAIGVLAFGSRMGLGICSSVFAIRYRSLRASFVVHATFNGALCVVSVLIQR